MNVAIILLLFFIYSTNRSGHKLHLALFPLVIMRIAISIYNYNFDRTNMMVTVSAWTAIYANRIDRICKLSSNSTKLAAYTSNL